MSRSDFVAIAIRGRLGNQLFQFAAAKALAPEGTAIAIDGVTRHRRALFDALRPGEVRLMTQAEMLTRLRPPRLPAGDARRDRLQHRLWKGFDLVTNRALVRRLYGDRQLWEAVGPGRLDPAFRSARPPVLLDGFFQHEQYFAGAEERVVGALRAPSAAAEERWRAVECEIASGSTPIAVVVRAGADYDAYGWTLPLAWYRRAVERIVATAGRCDVVVFSDVGAAREDAADGLRDLGPTHVIDDLSPVDQLQLIGRCPHAVVSNSTFAWWARGWAISDPVATRAGS